MHNAGTNSGFKPDVHTRRVMLTLRSRFDMAGPV